MAVKICCNCEERYNKGVSGFDMFPREDHKWCSWKCLFMWLLKHDVKHNGNYITEIQKRDNKAILKLEDYVNPAEMALLGFEYSKK